MDLNSRLNTSIDNFNSIKKSLEDKFNDANTKKYLKKNYGKLYSDYSSLIIRYNKISDEDKITTRIKKIDSLVLKLENIKNLIIMQEKKELKLVIETNEALSEISSLIEEINKKRYEIKNTYIADDKLYSKKEEIKKMYNKAISFDKDNYNNLVKTINDLKILNKFLDVYKKEIENH